MKNTDKTGLQTVGVNPEIMFRFSLAVFVAFAVTYSGTLLLPLYPDEVQVRLFLSRLGYDFPFRITGAPTCLATACQQIPVTMYVPGIINWLVHGVLPNPFTLRLAGAVISLSWLSLLLVYLIRRTDAYSIGNDIVRHRAYIAAFLLSLFSIGVFPFFFVLNRNEQFILPVIAGLVYIFIDTTRKRTERTLLRRFSACLLYFVLVPLALHAHAKALFFVPFYLLVGIKIFYTKKLWPGYVVLFSLLGLHIFQAYTAWSTVFKCPETPQLESLFKSFSFDPLSVIYSPAEFWGKAWQSIAHTGKYLMQLGFQRNTDIAYLPAIHIGVEVVIVNFLIKILVSFMAIFVAVGISVGYVKDLREGKLLTINSVLLSLLICVFLSALFNLPKNWYDAGFIYALLLIILIFLVGENFSYIPSSKMAGNIFLCVVFVSLASQAIFAAKYPRKFLKGYAGPGVPLVTANAKQLESDIVGASAVCGIDPDRSEKLIVDDWTYFHFRKTRYPMPITYIFYETDHSKLLQFFAASKPGGLIVNCPSLAAYEGSAKRKGMVCCISSKDLLTLPPPFKK